MYVSFENGLIKIFVIGNRWEKNYSLFKNSVYFDLYEKEKKKHASD